MDMPSAGMAFPAVSEGQWLEGWCGRYETAASSCLAFAAGQLLHRGTAKL